jgi:HEAT repeat protein
MTYRDLVSLRLLLAAACLTAIVPVVTLAQPPAEDKLLEVLASQADAPQKCSACRELRLVGTEKAVPALAALLTNPETSHAARIGLESMPYPAAGAALRDAAGKTAGPVKSGILDSLGERRDPLAVPLAAAALEDKDAMVVAAAATALGKIGTSDAAKALTAVRTKARGDAAVKIGTALVVCADRLRKDGKADEARAIYYDLDRMGVSFAVREAAIRGAMQMAGAGSQIVFRITGALHGGCDVCGWHAAAGHLSRLSAADLRAVAAKMTELPATSQVSLLAAMRIRGDRSFAPLALEAAKSKDETVRLAAVRALGTVGDVGALPVLVELGAAQGPVGDAARQSLEAVCGPKVDEGVVALLQAEKDPVRRAAWIALVEARRPAGAAQVLLKEAVHASPEVRTRAMAALAKLGRPDDLAAMVAAALKAEKGPERDNAEKAVMLVCQQIPDAAKRADPVVGIFRNATPADRAELLPLLGRIGGTAARQIVQESLDGKDASLREAGLRGLCNWPDASVSEQLLKLAKEAPEARHRIWALRALVRVVSLPGDTPDDKRLAALKQVMPLAARDEDRALVLERAAAVRIVDSLRFVAPYMDQPALGEAACKAVVELARHRGLRDPNKQEFDAALEKVLKTSKDAGTLERAKRYLQGA